MNPIEKAWQAATRRLFKIVSRREAELKVQKPHVAEAGIPAEHQVIVQRLLSSSDQSRVTAGLTALAIGSRVSGVHEELSHITIEAKPATPGAEPDHYVILKPVGKIRHTDLRSVKAAVNFELGRGHGRLHILSTGQPPPQVTEYVQGKNDQPDLNIQLQDAESWVCTVPRAALPKHLANDQGYLLAISGAHRNPGATYDVPDRAAKPNITTSQLAAAKINNRDLRRQLQNMSASGNPAHERAAQVALAVGGERLERIVTVPCVAVITRPTKASDQTTALVIPSDRDGNLVEVQPGKMTQSLQFLTSQGGIGAVRILDTHSASEAEGDHFVFGENLTEQLGVDVSIHLEDSLVENPLSGKAAGQEF